MGLIISTVILYSIILGIDILVKKNDRKKGKKINGMDHLIVVVVGNGILSYICSSSNYTDSMRTTIIAIFTVLYVLFGLICLKIDNEK